MERVIREYAMAGRGMTAPGAIVLRQIENPHHPYAVHFRNDADSEAKGAPVYYYGDYCETEAEGEQAFRDKVRRYDPDGELHRLRLRTA